MVEKGVVVAALLAVAPSFAGNSSLESLQSLPGLVLALQTAAEEDAVSVDAVETSGIDYERRCQDVVFESDRGALSDTFTMHSRSWQEDCRPIPHGGCIPDRREWNHIAVVTIDVVGRVAPAPREVFNVCLNGPWLNLRIKESPFRYDVRERDGRFTLTRKQAE